MNFSEAEPGPDGIFNMNQLIRQQIAEFSY